MAEATPVRVKKLGHVVFTVTDIERTTSFWTEIMGFHVSDRNERGMVFLRNASAGVNRPSVYPPAPYMSVRLNR